MTVHSLLGASLFALTVTACKDAEEGTGHDHADLLRTIEDQQDSLDEQATELAKLQDTVAELSAALGAAEDGLDATNAMVADNGTALSEHDARIADLEGTVTAIDTATLTDGIAANAEAIAAIEASAPLTAEDLIPYARTVDVTANTVAIAANASMISTNATTIGSNTLASSTNADAIAAIVAGDTLGELATVSDLADYALASSVTDLEADITSTTDAIEAELIRIDGELGMLESTVDGLDATVDINSTTIDSITADYARASDLSGLLTEADVADLRTTVAINTDAISTTSDAVAANAALISINATDIADTTEDVLAIAEESESSIGSIVYGDYEIYNSIDASLLAGVEEITGTLTIAGSVVDISDLADLTTIGSNLIVSGTTELSTILPLSGVESVGGDIKILGNSSLEDIDGLSGLTSGLPGAIIISDNDALGNLDGLAGVTSIEGELFIGYNTVLEEVDGLINVETIGGTLYLNTNPALTNIDGLAGISSVALWVQINGNESLIDISGLSGASVGQYISFSWNSSLCDSTGPALFSTMDIGTYYGFAGGLSC